MDSIKLGTLLGDKLYKLAKEEDVKICLEVGTADGKSSSYCIAKGLKESGGLLFTFEADLDIMKKAINNLKQYNFPVFFLHGSALPLGYLKDWEQYAQEINTSKYLPSTLLPEMERRYNGQKQYYSQKNASSLIDLCNYITFFDLVFLDGGTFTSYDEMLFLQNKITKYLILDDTNPENGGRKNVKTRIELLNSENWDVLEDHYENRTGWMLLKRRINGHPVKKKSGKKDTARLKK